MEAGSNDGSVDTSPESLASLFAGLAKACSVYPRNHPRVRGTAARLEGALAAVITAPKWLTIRVRGRDLVIGDRVVDGGAPAVRWLVSRCREASLAGIEVAPGVDAEALIEFTVALGRCGGRRGQNLAEQWPGDHNKVRPLDLVFLGDHQQTSAEEVAVSDVATHNFWQLELLRRFAADVEIQTRLVSLQRSCRSITEASSADLDVLDEIVHLMPAELVSDQERAVEVVKRVLDRVHVGLLDLQRGQRDAGSAPVLRKALAVAKKYFESDGGPGVSRDDLHAGRPEDDSVTADLGRLLAELDALPADDDLHLPPASWFRADAPTQRAEQLGIGLHLLATTERPETLARLQELLPKLLADNPVLDEYLRVGPGELRSPAGDAVTLQILGFLTQLGQQALLMERQYVDPGLVCRTFPASVVAVTRLCGALPGGIEILRRGLLAIGRDQLAAGVETLARSGVLADLEMLRVLVAVGDRTVLPLMARAAVLDDAEVRQLVVDYLRVLPLPDAEAAALRCLHPASLLPKAYVLLLCRVAEQGEGDADARLLSGQLLRTFVDQPAPDLPLRRRLQAIAGLRHLDDPDTVAFLSRLARRGRFTRFGPTARAVRKTAGDALSRIRRELLQQ